MKKNILGMIVAVGVVLSPFSASAQWTTSGVNIYNSNTGNVGIGGAAPLGKMHLNGTTLVDFFMSDSSQALNEKNWVWQTGSATGAGVFRLRAVNDGATDGINALEFTRTGISAVKTAFMGGNVGIGTSTPAVKLDVNGAANISGNLKIGSTITSDGDICIGTCS